MNKLDTSKPHFALIKIRSVYHEGDERSRTCPGHGYPAHTEEFNEYVPYATEAELIDAIATARRYSLHATVVAIQVTPLAIKTQTRVELVKP